MDKPKVTPKDFFLWAGVMVAFYWSIIAFIFLAFSYIDYAYPTALVYIQDPYQGSMPYEMASIVVLFPVFILLMWIIRRDIAADTSRANIWVRKWALIFTLFVAGLSVVIDLVTLLTSFFRGEELTTAFVLKVCIVFLIAALAFMHFIADFWGYWEKFPERNRYVLYAVAILAAFSIVAGFFIVGSPRNAYLHRIDDKKVMDLQNIQQEVVYYWQAKQQLPLLLNDLNDPLTGFTVPVDPQAGHTYRYEKTGELTFKVCADFNTVSDGSDGNGMIARPVGPGGVGDASQQLWPHQASQTCFDRTIDPAKFPALDKSAAPVPAKPTS